MAGTRSKAAAAVLSAREYLRVSQDRDGTGKSPDQQHNENQRASDDHGWSLGTPYRDDDRSASRYTRKKREDFDRLLLDLDDGSFGADILILWESSRGSRKVEEGVKLLDLCEKRDVKIYVTTHSRLYDPHNARDRRTLLEDWVDAEYESAKTSQRIRRDVRANASLGRPHGKILYGYRREYDYDARGNRYFRAQIIREDQAVVVREAARRIAAGESCYTIANDFNARGIPTPRKPNNPANIRRWDMPQIKRMVINYGYIGKRTHNGEVVGDAVWPAILDDETFYICRTRLTDPSRSQIQDGKTKYLLSGFLIGPCRGKTRVGKQRSGYRTYECKEDFCTTRRQSFVDDYIEELAIERLSRPDVQEILASAESDTSSEVAALSERRARLSELQQMTVKGQISPASFAAMEKPILDDITRLKKLAGRKSLGPVLSGVAGPGAAAAWKKLSMDRKREIIRTLFEEIKMLPIPGHGGRRVFDPRKISYKWRESF